MDARPVGFFDSGLGGASVLRSALAALPGESYVYYGDNRFAPYGDRTEDEITRLTLKSARRLRQEGVKAIVVACNTATATCIRAIRSQLDIPVVSVEPAIKPACMAPGNGRVLMLATLATTRLARYLALQSRMPDPDRVVNVPCPGLVERIESGVFDDDAFDDLLDGYLRPYHGMRVDGVVLGCTHYVFIRGAIARYVRAHFAGPARFYDGNDATALQLRRVLEARALLSDAGAGTVRFLTSGDPSVFEPMFFALLSQGALR